jgi:hypothetical protein
VTVSSPIGAEWEYWTCETTFVRRAFGLIGENRSVVKLTERPEDADRFFGGQTTLDEPVVVEAMTREGWDLYEVEPKDEDERERRLHFRRRKARFRSDTHLVLGLGYGRADGRTHVSIPSIDPTPIGKIVVLPNGLSFRFLGVTSAFGGSFDTRLLGTRSFAARNGIGIVGVLELQRTPEGVREIDLREAEFTERERSLDAGAAGAVLLSYHCGYYRADGAIVSGQRGDLVSSYPLARGRPNTVTSGETRLSSSVDEPLRCEFLLFNGPRLGEFEPPVVRYPFTITSGEQSIGAARQEEQPLLKLDDSPSWRSWLGVLMTVVVVGIFIAAVAGLASGRWNPAGALGDSRAAPAPGASPVAGVGAVASPSPAEKAAGQGQEGVFVEVANTDGEGVYLRRTPNMADRLVAWPDGTRLEVIGPDVDGDGRRWKRVRDPSRQEGYVPEQYTVPARPR